MNTITEKLQAKRLGGIQTKWLFNGAIVLFGSFLIAISAKIALPLFPVPVTLQTMAVLFLGMLFGSGLAVSAVVAYLVEAAIGLPVLNGPVAGLAVFMGPTAGYLLGFIFAAAFTGYMARKGNCRTWFRAFLTAIFGSLLILTAGVLSLSFAIGPEMAVTAGLLPFIFGDVLKSLVLAIIVPALYAREQKH